MNKIINSLFYFLFSHSFVFGQTPLNITDFLKASNTQESVVFQYKKNEFLSTHSYETPLIKKLQFRTEINSFDIREQEYLLRASINSFKRISKQDEYQRSIKNTATLDLALAETLALKERYDILVNLLGLTAILKVKKQQNILLQDRVTLFNRSIVSPGFNILDLIEAEDAQQKNDQSILDLESKISIYNNYVQQLMDIEGAFFLETKALIKVDKIKEILSQAELEVLSHPQLAILTSEIAENLIAYELEQVKSKFSIGYIQAKFSDRPNDDFREKISIGIGFDIPFKHSDRLDFNKLELKILETQSIYKNTRQQLTNNRAILYTQLQNLIQKYHLVQSQLDNNQAAYALQEYSKIAEAPPAALLKLRESTLDKELLLQEIQLEIRQLFIEYLNVTGALGQQVRKNYLYQNVERY